MSLPVARKDVHPFLLLSSLKTMTSLQPITRGVLSVDVEATENAEKSLDEFINKRSKPKRGEGVIANAPV